MRNDPLSTQSMAFAVSIISLVKDLKLKKESILYAKTASAIAEAVVHSSHANAFSISLSSASTSARSVVTLVQKRTAVCVSLTFSHTEKL